MSISPQNSNAPPFILPLPGEGLPNPNSLDCGPDCGGGSVASTTVHSKWRKKSSKSVKSHLLRSDYTLIETFVNADYYLGLSPFRISEKTSFVSNWFSKLIFIFFNGCAIFHDLCQLRLLTMSYELYKGHQKLVYVFLGYRAALAYMQFRYFQLLWWKRYKFTRLIRAMEQSTTGGLPLSAMRRSTCWSKLKFKLLPILICFISLISSVICVVFGFNQLNEASSWSFHTVLDRYRDDLIISLFIPSIHPNGTVTLTSFTQFLSTNKVASLGLGITGAMIDVATELIHFCTYDMFLIATVTIWLCAQDLQLEEIPGPTSSTRRSSTCGVSCENFRRSQVKAQKLLDQHNQLSNISREINEIVKLFLPPLTTATVIMVTYIIHLVLQRKWFTAFYVAVKLAKPCVGFMLAVKITDRIDEWKCWFLTDATQQKLQLGFRSLQIKLTELALIPVGMGTGGFYIDTRFVSSLLGIISTYFFLIREGFQFGDG